jgi:hypothetical protein
VTAVVVVVVVVVVGVSRDTRCNPALTARRFYRVDLVVVAGVNLVVVGIRRERAVCQSMPALGVDTPVERMDVEALTTRMDSNSARDHPALAADCDKTRPVA